jgi:hypothetical protein
MQLKMKLNARLKKENEKQMLRAVSRAHVIRPGYETYDRQTDLELGVNLLFCI